MRQGTQLQINRKGQFNPHINVWGIPTTPNWSDNFKVTISEEYRAHILTAAPIVMKESHPQFNAMDIALIAELGFAANTLCVIADNSGKKGFEWRIVPAWEPRLNIATLKLPTSLTIKGVGAIEVRSEKSGRKKLGDLCGHMGGSTDPIWVVEAVTEGPITFDKSQLDTTSDLFDKLVHSPRTIELYRAIEEEYLRTRMKLLAEQMKPWADARKELPQFEVLLGEIIEETLLQLLKKEEQEITTAAQAVTGGRRRS